MSSVSVLLNVWGQDDEELLKKSLTSVFRQERKPNELVIVIDGPLPTRLQNSLATSLEKATCPVRQEQLSRNYGLWHSRNIGISICENELIAIHDADDIMHPCRLANQVSLFEQIRPTVLGSAAYEFNIKTETITGLRRTITDRPLTLKDTWLKNPIHHSSAMISKRGLSDIGLYRSCSGAEDLELWRRLIRNGALLVNTSLILQVLSSGQDLLSRRKMSRSTFGGELKLMKAQLTSGQFTEASLAPMSFLLRSAYRSLPVRLMKPVQNRFLSEADAGQNLTLNDYLTNPVPQSAST